MEKKTPENDNINEIKFQYFSLKFTPLKSLETKLNSNDIMRNVITYISNKLHNDRQGHLIDRHEDRLNSRREMYMNRAVFMHKERKLRCSMALLRSGREPLIKPKEGYKLFPINDLGSIAEETHFYIDFSKSYAVVCCEYNYYGPRISDIEYYFRNIAHTVLRESKATEVNIYMDVSIDKTLERLKNVLNFEVKVQPKNLVKLDIDLVGKYFTGLNSIGNMLKPKFIKIETLFQTPGRKVESKELNKEANKMVIEMLNRFRGRSFNIDAFDAFVVKYEDKEGNEDVFNLLSGKRELILNIDIKNTKSKDLFELIIEDFNNFMATI